MWVDVPSRSCLSAGGCGSHSPQRTCRMGSGLHFPLALPPPKDAHRTAHRWLHAPSAATRRLQQVCDPALEPSRAALPGARDSTLPSRASQPTATSFLWPGRECPTLCDVQLLRINRYSEYSRSIFPGYYYPSHQEMATAYRQITHLHNPRN